MGIKGAVADTVGEDLLESQPRQVLGESFDAGCVRPLSSGKARADGCGYLHLVQSVDAHDLFHNIGRYGNIRFIMALPA